MTPNKKDLTPQEAKSKKNKTKILIALIFTIIGFLIILMGESIISNAPRGDGGIIGLFGFLVKCSGYFTFGVSIISLISNLKYQSNNKQDS
ncbi:MAG: hypothetical protein BM564_13285 [Bacteroidetes bacterium MedPE-SWsnd-G2]|nr:MAG: hypothetical protein BM564_13285 [Bacteroidetes bacterium MedPE-SWsnd-G2]